MKIALIVERLDTALGGAELSVWQLAEQLRRRGHTVDMLAATAAADIQGVTRLCDTDPKRRAAFGAFCRALQAHLSRQSYDIVHSVLPLRFADLYQPRGGTYPETVLQTAASYQNAALGWFKRATAFANWRRQAYWRAEKDLCQRGAALIAALSEYVRRQFLTHYGLSADRIAVVPNGVAAPPPAMPRELEHIRQVLTSAFGRLDAKTDALFLFAANNFRLKGLGALLAGLAAAQKAAPSRRLCLAIVGGGDAKPYRRIAQRLGILRQVLFVGYQRQIAPWLAVCNAAVLPTWYDPCSRFILEALSAGKPVLTTRFNGAAERFEHGRHGIIVATPADAADVAAGLAALADPARRAQMAAAIAQDKIQQELSIETHVERLERVYQDILRRKKKI